MFTNILKANKNIDMFVSFKQCNIVNYFEEYYAG